MTKRTLHRPIKTMKGGLLNQEFIRNFMVLRVVIVTNSYDAELSWAAATFKLAASCETMRPAVL